MDKLDSVCKQLDLREFSSLLDNTDMLVNLEQLDLPAEMQSTDELMAAQGNWVDAKEAFELLTRLLSHLKENKIRFGLLKDARGDIIDELAICLKFVTEAADNGAKFNFAIVM
jgi:hypothetical protein